MTDAEGQHSRGGGRSGLAEVQLQRGVRRAPIGAQHHAMLGCCLHANQVKQYILDLSEHVSSRWVCTASGMHQLSCDIEPRTSASRDGIKCRG